MIQRLCKLVFVLATLFSTGSSLAQERKDAIEFPPLRTSNVEQSLTIYSTLDIGSAKPLIEGFQKLNPFVRVLYEDLQSLEIYERVLAESDDEAETADLVFSSAMDLQMKLANDGYAKRLTLPSFSFWPSWANWRDTAVALTFEPSVTVYHKPTFSGQDFPQTRADLQSLLQKESDQYYGRIATYDIERAGVGFLFLARDAEHHRDIWEFVQTMSASGVKLYSNSSAILDRVSDGRFAIGYNILGSYAAAWAEKNPNLGLVLPSDYTVVMSRIALVPEAARKPELGERFLGFLMSRDGQEIMAGQSNLPALHPEVTGPNTASALREEIGAQLRPISVSPGLLVYLDQAKRARFLTRWNKALREK